MTPKNTICIWYDGTALDAAQFYAATFPDSRVRAVHRVSFSGWLAPLLDRSVGRDVRKGLPVTMASLKRFVERAPHSAT